MSDRPTGANGKRSQAWGTTATCPACGQCLCFGCHPRGPCVDESESQPVSFLGASAADRAERFGASAGWTCAPAPSPGVPGLQLRAGAAPGGTLD